MSGREPDGKGRTDLFAAIGRFAYRRRWLVVAVWVVLFAGGIALTPRLSHVLKGSGFSASNSRCSRPTPSSITARTMS